MLHQTEIAAIIGHWRNGATISEICAATWLSAGVILEVIDWYQNEQLI